jgi:hypothetical protein
MNNTQTQNAQPQKMVKINILDKTGHTTLEKTIDEAIKTAFTLKFTNGQELNVRSEKGISPFQLHAKDINDAEGLLQDTIRFHKVLSEYADPVIFVTGELVGGAI